MRGRRGREVRRALRLTMLSTVFPGLGLVFTRRHRFGFLLLTSAALVALALAFLVANGGIIEAASRFLTEKGLYSLLALFMVGGVLWVFGIMLTARETSKRGWGGGARWLMRLFTAAMCLVVAVPAARATQYVLVTQDAFNSIFQDHFSGRGAQAQKPGGGSDPWKDVPRLNMLLLGSDAGKGRQNTRTDSMMIASINTKTGDTALISVPRNLENVPIPESNPLHSVYPNGYKCPQHACLMDAIWHEVEINHPDLFKGEQDAGLHTTEEVLEQVVGLDIDYTVVINLAGFQQLVDSMGGVKLNVPKPGIAIGGSIKNGREVPGSVTGMVKPGYRKLNGYEALWYSRSRVRDQDGDNSRMRRQRCMVNALISQSNPPKLLKQFPDIMSAAAENIRIDMPRDDLPAFANLAQRMKGGNMRSVSFSKVINGADPDFGKIHSLVQEAINAPHDPAAPKATSTATPTPTDTESSSDDPTDGSPSSTPTHEAITDTTDAC
ncbi:LCP family protein [Luteipulveratus mongoliensis]|uniref:Cell envelope-related transcriptional attenuator domain-containing protein n=1 Tax=Luteipulveratus mongoliensis TaxID=571913 RepID=A0A0K1JNY1_9MICO|nr:LCP family protein [Luteipulveratus mongoliensis]AKU18293.1 hypothetical protein VV02_24705 [Luteipulveratus mongoliensis]